MRKKERNRGTAGVHKATARTLLSHALALSCRIGSASDILRRLVDVARTSSGLLTAAAILTASRRTRGTPWGMIGVVCDRVCVRACSRWCARRTDLYLGASRPADDRRSASVSAKKRTTGWQEGGARGSLSDPTAGHATEVAADPICEMEEILCRIMDGGTRAHDTPPLNRPASPRPPGGEKPGEVSRGIAISHFRANAAFPFDTRHHRPAILAQGLPVNGNLFPRLADVRGDTRRRIYFFIPRGRNSNNCFELITPRRAMRRRDRRCASREADKRMFPVNFFNACSFFDESNLPRSPFLSAIECE